MNNKTNTQTQNNEAISKRNVELENGILTAFIALDRAKHLLEDTVDEYFGAFNEENKDSHSAIIFKFSRYRAYTECASILISDAYYELQKLGASRFVE